MSKDDIFEELECVRCGSIDNLVRYSHKEWEKTSTQTRRKGIYEVTETSGLIWEIGVPACMDCAKKFKSTLKAYSISKLLLFPFGLFISFFALPLFLIIPTGQGNIFSKSQPYLTIVTLSLGVALIIIGIGGRIKYKRSTYFPGKYIDIDIDIFIGKPRVKDRSSDKWIPFNVWTDNIWKKRKQQGTLDEILIEKQHKIVQEALQEKLQETIRSLFKENEAKAFSLQALTNRIESSFKSLENLDFNIKNILEKLVLTGVIRKTQKNDEFYYSYIKY
jgi:hypothetical protein